MTYAGADSWPIVGRERSSERPFSVTFLRAFQGREIQISGSSTCHHTPPQACAQPASELAASAAQPQDERRAESQRQAPLPQQEEIVRVSAAAPKAATMAEVHIGCLGLLRGLQHERE